MSQQGERPTDHEDDWWGELYDDSTGDAGPASAADTLDDRFASAAGTVGRDTEAPPPAPPVPGDPSAAAVPPAAPDRSVPEAQPGTAPGERGPDPRGGRPRTESRAPGVPAGAVDPPLPAIGGDEPDPPGGPVRKPAPWESRSARPTGPVTFPATPEPPGRSTRSPRGGTPTEPTAVPSPRSPADPATAPACGPPPDTPSPTGRSPADRRLPPPPPPPFDAAPRGPVPHAPPADPRSLLDTDSRTSMNTELRAPADTDVPDQATPEPSTPANADPHTPANADRRTPTEADPHGSQKADRPPAGHAGSGPAPDDRPGVLPPADADALEGLVPDTVLDGGSFGTCTLRAVSARGDSARRQGEPRRDFLLTARFGTGEQALVLVAMATGAPGVAAEVCRWIGRAVGRSHLRLGEDIRSARRGELKSGLQRLTDRCLGTLRADAVERGLALEEYSATLRCLLLPADPSCRTRVFFGVGAGGLFRLRDGAWQNIEPRVADASGEAVVGFGSPSTGTPGDDRLTVDLGIITPPGPDTAASRSSAPSPRGGGPVESARDPFRFRASIARPGDTLLLCTGGLADPLRAEPGVAEHLRDRWSTGEPPGLAAFLADIRVRAEGCTDDRTAVAVWEA
ncbi:protein phosphatase 2C domain-containing protein [Streptomyces nodosus]|uniref:protein phosphatase 2C domain-containing protein n=1 Tax=Streptomyces nodosus TaxID=40318 RepID=UPI0036E7DA6C